MTQVVWFRRDLRLDDHGALHAAAGEDVLPLFVVDPLLWHRVGALRRSRIAAALAGLDSAIRQRGGAGLVVRHGDPAAEVLDAARSVGAHRVLHSAEFTPYGVARDARVRETLEGAGVEFDAVDSPYLHPPGTVRTADGEGYRVFTPYYRAWAALPRAVAFGPPRATFVAAPGIGLPRQEVDVVGGADAALAALDAFRTGPAARYDADRNRPDRDATSRLGAALHFGEVHPRTVVDRLGGPTGPAAGFVRQLCWRDFYADVMFRLPHAATANVDSRFDAMPWLTGPESDRLFAAWTQGRTGYPFVDAGMRQLESTGWLHNRVRMVVASFLTKDLLIHWNRGARWFLHHLLDADVANNALGWQWTAGTGTDAAPYFRVFNPVLQGLKFDPEGEYVRRYIPELRHLAGSAAHEPWRVADGYAHRYPPRIVDHAAARARALQIYDMIKGSPSDR